MDNLANDSHDNLNHYYKMLAALDDDHEGKPRSLGDCVADDREIDMHKYQEFLELEDKFELAEQEWFDSLNKEETPPHPKKKKKAKKARKHLVKTLRPYYFGDYGEMVFLKPEQTYWYLVYVKTPLLEDAKWQKKFQRCF
jgi:hypothetical protein